MIERIEYDRLLLELEFYSTDNTIKQRLADNIQRSFNTCVLSIVKDNPSLLLQWEAFERKHSKALDVLLVDQVSEVVKTMESSPDLKVLYHQIAKLTHPDKVENKVDLYVQATDAYNSHDLVSLLIAAKKTGIEYPLDNELLEAVRKRLTAIKAESAFIESTIAWKWYYAQNEASKDDLVAKYIVSQLGY